MIMRFLVVWNNNCQVTEGGIKWNKDVATCWTWPMDDLTLNGFSVGKVSVRCIY
jgi:hypothetical protein